MAERIVTVGQRLLGRYEVLQAIARGGFGVVFKGRDVETDQLVAIKQLLTDDEGQLQRFDREMKLTRKLHSPHTVRLIDYGQEDGSPIMVLEFVEGETLHDRLKTGSFRAEYARDIIKQVLASLAEAHDHGIVHRDIKPPNIMLDGAEDATHAKLLDFGTAGVEAGHESADLKKITKFGEIQGTPAYMAPEQILEFGNACTQSDLYAVGLILYEMVVGERAYNGANSLEICTAQVQQPLPMTMALQQSALFPVILKACAKKTEERYQTAGEMIAALDDVDLTQRPMVHAETIPAMMPARKLATPSGAVSDKKLQIVIGVLIGLIIVVVLLFLMK